MTDKDLAVDQPETEETDEKELSEDEQAMARLKEAIEVERVEVGPLRLKLTVTVPRDTVDERMSKQFLDLKRDALVPGFRKGRAPLKLVEKRFGTDVGDQLKTELISRGYLAAVEKEELKPLGDPLFWVLVEEERTGDDLATRKVETQKLLPLDKALDHVELPKDEPLTFVCEIELKPDFELPDLEKIPVTKPVISIEDEDVELELKRIRKGKGTFKPVEGGAIERDDLLYAAMKMSVDEEVIVADDNVELAARDLRLLGVPLVGFGDAVTGKTVKDQVVFEATVPDDHENIAVRGKTARFEFTILEIKRLEIPPFDEAFLARMGFGGEDELRSAVRSALESRLDQTIKQAMYEQVGQYLVEQTALEIPTGLSQRQTDRSIARRTFEMYRANVPEAEIAKAVDEMRAKAHEQVVRDLKLVFILEKVAERHDINITEEQVNSSIAQIARQSGKRFDRVRDELSKGEGLASLYLQLRDQEVLAALLRDAEITEEEGPKKKKASPRKKKKSKATE